MSLGGKDRARVEEIGRAIETWRVGDAPILSALVPELPVLLGDCFGAAYGVSSNATHYEVDFAYGAQGETQRKQFVEFVGRQKRVPWGLYDPASPPRAQRNRVFNVGLWITRHLSGEALVRATALHRRIFLDHSIRVLVCEGPSLLAWFGAGSEGPFCRRQELLFAALVPRLRRRLILERQLADAGLAQATVGALLEAMPRAAFIVTATGSVRHANSAGRLWLETKGRTLRRNLLDAVLGNTGARGLTVTRLAAPGLPDHFLVLATSPAAEVVEDVATLSARHGLTGRQAQVAALLAQGHANKTIAAMLRCATHTVELHVSEVLRKTGSSSRVEFVARILTGRRSRSGR